MANCVVTTFASTFFKSYHRHEGLTTDISSSSSSSSIQQQKQKQKQKQKLLLVFNNRIINKGNYPPIKQLSAIGGGGGGGGAAGTGSEGLTNATTTTTPSNDLLDSVQVFDLNGNPFFLSDLWEHRKAVVAFARHFGCVLCRRRADYLAAKKDQMDASGVALILIGPGSVDQAKVFAQQTKFPGEIYADPNHSSYEALRFVSGVSTTFTPTAGLRIIQSYMEGYRQDWGLSSHKDTVTKGGWQQGGILVAGPGKNNISYIHRDKEAGDDPPIDDIIKACCCS